MDHNSVQLTDKELDNINWRATRGCHFEGNLLPGSEYVEEIIEQDVPRIIAELRRMWAKADTSICAYCGTECKKESEEIAAHVLTCEKRPEKKLGEMIVNLSEELERLRAIIIHYATTPMPFEKMMEAAFGERRAMEIMGVTDAQQSELLEQWPDAERPEA